MDRSGVRSKPSNETNHKYAFIQYNILTLLSELDPSRFRKMLLVLKTTITQKYNCRKSLETKFHLLCYAVTDSAAVVC